MEIQNAKYVDIAPLISFRILFGLLMAVGGIRFWYEGWIVKLFVEPKLFFKYYGFEWVEVPSEMGLYALFLVMIVSALCIAFGFIYRVMSVLFFCLFTYIELLDATNYLNHYYLIICFAFLLIFLPANSAFSLDVKFSWVKQRKWIPRWNIDVLKAQLLLVYTCAGIAKLNSDWLFQGMPMAVWLPERSEMPLLGILFGIKGMPLFFSWCGAIYDLSIAWFLLFSRTRTIAYFFVVVFHLMTFMMFNIGLFPFIMIFLTTIFFEGQTHRKVLQKIGFNSPNNFDKQPSHTAQKPSLQYSEHTVRRYDRGVRASKNFNNRPTTKAVVLIFILIQFLMPFRHWLYKGDVLWTEEGYRFSWRVMVVEKNGQAIFSVSDPETGRTSEIINGQYLTLFQEKQMAIQPDMMIQFAHFLDQEFQEKYSIENPVVKVQSSVALNGRSSRTFANPNVDLSKQQMSLKHYDWIDL